MSLAIKVRFFLSISAVLLVLGGCGAVTESPKPAMQTTGQHAARRLDDAGLKSFIEKASGRPASSTWDVRQMTLAAFYFNPDLDVARSQWEASKAARITAGQRPNPSIGVTPARDATQPSPWLFGLTINLPIETGGLEPETVTAALTALPAELREIVVAHLWGGRTFEQIATLTGLSTSTAHRRYLTALESLRERLREPCPTTQTKPPR